MAAHECTRSNRARTGRQKLGVTKQVARNKKTNMKVGDGGNGKSTMSERNEKNKRKRLQHEESMTTKHDSNKQQLLTEESDDSENDSMIEEDAQDNSSRRDSQDVEKKDTQCDERDREGMTYKIDDNRMCTNDHNLRNAWQTTRHSMREYVKTQVFKEYKFVDRDQRKNTAAKLVEEGLNNNNLRKFEGVDHHAFVHECSKMIVQLTNERRQNVQQKMQKQCMSELMRDMIVCGGTRQMPNH